LIPFLEALLNVLAWHGVISETKMLQAFKQLRAKAVQAR
jgi:hypothetical protein